LPLAVNFFHIISPVSVIVNIFAIPALFAIIAMSIFSTMVNPVLPFLGGVFAESAKFFIGILISFLAFFSKLPGAYVNVEPQNIFAAIFYYVALFGIVEYRKKS